MKPIFAIDLTNNKKNEKTNGDEFIVRTVSSYNMDNYEESQKEFHEALKKAKLPLLLRILRVICMYLGLIVVGATIKLIVEDSISDFPRFYASAPYIFWVGGAAILVWVVLSILSAKRRKGVLDSQETTETVSELEQSLDEIYEELGVPENAADVDILAFRYVVKNGEPIVKSNMFSSISHANVEIKAFVENGSLFIVDVEHCFELPLSKITAIKTVKKTAILPGWNKNEEPYSPKYKEYNITKDKYENLYIRHYHILEIDRLGEKYGLYFPSYELPIFEELTGLKAEEVK